MKRRQDKMAEELRRQMHAPASQGFTIDKDHGPPDYSSAPTEQVKSAMKDASARKKK